jgi:hypothetical protein
MLHVSFENQWNQWVAMSFLRFDDPCVINFDGVFEGAVGAGCALPGNANLEFLD